jgi:hypothetical protein
MLIFGGKKIKLGDDLMLDILPAGVPIFSSLNNAPLVLIWSTTELLEDHGKSKAATSFQLLSLILATIPCCNSVTELL